MDICRIVSSLGCAGERHVLVPIAGDSHADLACPACSKSILPVRERRFSERDIREPGSCDDILTLASASVEPDRAARVIEICCHIWPLLEIVGLSGPPSGPAHREVPGIDCSTQIRGRPYYHGSPGYTNLHAGFGMASYAFCISFSRQLRQSGLVSVKINLTRPVLNGYLLSSFLYFYPPASRSPSVLLQLSFRGDSLNVRTLSYRYCGAFPCPIPIGQTAESWNNARSVKVLPFALCSTLGEPCVTRALVKRYKKKGLRWGSTEFRDLLACLPPARKMMILSDWKYHYLCHHSSSHEQQAGEGERKRRRLQKSIPPRCRSVFYLQEIVFFAFALAEPPFNISTFPCAPRPYRRGLIAKKSGRELYRQ